LQELLRADTGPTPEKSLKMVLAEVHDPGDFLQIRLPLKVLLQEENSPLDPPVIFL
jgi:hypothetical protein